MSGCLKPRECEEIQAVSLLLNMMCVCVCVFHASHVRACCVCVLQEESQRGRIAASEKLVASLLRSDKPNWFKLLKIALENCDLDEARDMLETSNTSSVCLSIHPSYPQHHHRHPVIILTRVSVMMGR